jgi:hypothetical protein
MEKIDIFVEHYKSLINELVRLKKEVEKLRKKNDDLESIIDCYESEEMRW